MWVAHVTDVQMRAVSFLRLSCACADRLYCEASDTLSGLSAIGIIVVTSRKRRAQTSHALTSTRTRTRNLADKAAFCVALGIIGGNSHWRTLSRPQCGRVLQLTGVTWRATTSEAIPRRPILSRSAACCWSAPHRQLDSQTKRKTDGWTAGREGSAKRSARVLFVSSDCRRLGW
jgi:hypothetical protein